MTIFSIVLGGVHEIKNNLLRLPVRGFFRLRITPPAYAAVLADTSGVNVSIGFWGNTVIELRKHFRVERCIPMC